MSSWVIFIIGFFEIDLWTVYVSVFIMYVCHIFPLSMVSKIFVYLNLYRIENVSALLLCYLEFMVFLYDHSAMSGSLFIIASQKCLLSLRQAGKDLIPIQINNNPMTNIWQFAYVFLISSGYNLILYSRAFDVAAYGHVVVRTKSRLFLNPQTNSDLKSAERMVATRFLGSGPFPKKRPLFSSEREVDHSVAEALHGPVSTALTYRVD